MKADFHAGWMQICEIFFFTLLLCFVSRTVLRFSVPQSARFQLFVENVKIFDSLECEKFYCRDSVIQAQEKTNLLVEHSAKICICWV
jgi:hypothetical protein